MSDVPNEIQAATDALVLQSIRSSIAKLQFQVTEQASEADFDRKIRLARRNKQTLRQIEDEGLIDLAEEIKQQPLALPAPPSNGKKRGRPPGSKTRPTIAQVKAANEYTDAQDAEIEEEAHDGPVS